MNAIDTLRDAVNDALVVFVDTQWERAYRNTARDALARVETLLQAAEGMAAWEYEQQHASGAEMLLSLRLRIERVAAAVRDAKGDT